jgi:Ca-activated chloride channel family protein
MWGQLEGRTKIEIARDVMRELLADWDPTVDLGLVAYGHRQKGDCDDIETLVPVGPLASDRILAAIETIQPKGKTPLGASVRRAAQELRYVEEKATVILVSDGEETCGVDLCSLAESLERTGVDFTAHVIGFDLTGEQRASLTCLAEKTGGQFLSADNAAQLGEALRDAVRVVREVPPEAGQGRVWLDADEFGPGSPVVVHFETEKPFHPSAWIGFVPSAIPHGSEARNDDHDVVYARLGGRTEGSVTLASPASAGEWDARLHDHDGFGNEVAHASFRVRDVAARLWLDKQVFLPGERIPLHFELAEAPPSGAWLGIVPSEVAHGSEPTNDAHDLTYQKLHGRTEGTLEFFAPSELGPFDLRLNDSDDRGKEVAHVAFEVAEGADATVSLDKASYAPGEAMVVSFTTPVSYDPSAWAGIVPSAVEHGSEARNDGHDLAYRRLEGKTRGQLSFEAPAAPGSYDIRVHDTDRGGREVASVSFEVQ